MIDWHILKEIIKFSVNEKPITINISEYKIGDEIAGCNICKRIYQIFISRHTKFPLIRKKTFGVALLNINDKYKRYLNGKQMQYARRKINKAKREGYVFSEFTPVDYVNDISEINSSSTERQGRKIDSSYLVKKDVLKFHETGGKNYGIFDKDKKLVAYAVVPVCGEMCLLNRILGHNQHIENGVMFMLVNGIVNDIGSCLKQGQHIYLCYDTWFGASKGLRYFKEKLGLKPFKVKWKYLISESERIH